MRKPRFGEANFGAMAGAITGAIGGLFALGIPEAILDRNPAALVSAPRLGLICLLISGPIGWVLGGQIGPRLSNTVKTESVLGVVGGLIPVTLIALWGWWYVTRSL